VLTAGHLAPVDGVVVNGAAIVDQHRLTGESQPVEKGAGDPVLATTLVLGGNVGVRVDKTGAETAAARRLSPATACPPAAPHSPTSDCNLSLLPARNGRAGGAFRGREGRGRGREGSGVTERQHCTGVQMKGCAGSF
jgi:hypothetical protein